MTDKQIIDGKECRYWFRPNLCDYRKCSLRGENDNCDEIKDCFVKELLGKLAQKDEECKRLKEDIKTNGCGCFNIEMLEQLDQLKVENDECIKDNEYLKTIIKDLTQEVAKLKTTLSKIKEIALGVRNYLNYPSPRDVRYEMDIILQKISEGEV